MEENIVRGWHIWNFPDNVRICFADGFRKCLFETLKKIHGSRYKLAKNLELHPMTVKEYELGKSTYGRFVFIPVFILKKIIEILKESKFSLLIDDIEKHILKIRLEGGRSLLVHNPILPIRESEEFYSFVAHMIGDGCFSGYKNYYCNLDRKLVESFKKDLQIFGKFKTKEFIRDDGVIYVHFPSVISKVIQHLLNIKFTKPNRIPLQLFETTVEHKVAFIRAFMDDEGSVTGDKIYLTQKSKKILQQINSLLKYLGIRTGKIMKTQSNVHRFVILTDSYERFYNLIEFVISRKQKRLEQLITKLRSKPIPIKWQVLNLLKQRCPLATDVIASELGLRVSSVQEAVASLQEEGKISRQYTNSWKPRLWYPRVSNA